MKEYDVKKNQFKFSSLFRFMNLLQDQPHWGFLQSNIFIVIGYFIIFIGFCHLQQGTKSLGVLQIFRGMYNIYQMTWWRK